jgi:hypothetical protein
MASKANSPNETASKANSQFQSNIGICLKALSKVRQSNKSVANQRYVLLSSTIPDITEKWEGLDLRTQTFQAFKQSPANANLVT